MPNQLDFVRVFGEHGIAYRTRGANVGSGELNVKCPWCGTADPSYHLGINLASGAYKCWRNAAHRGRSPLRLLTKLLTYSTARDILRKYGISAVRPLPGSAGAQDSAGVRDTPRPFELSWPRGVALYDRELDARFSAYLVQRGFKPEDCDSVFARWDLRVGRYGSYSGRLVIPTCRGGRPVFFTARAITPAFLRYKACKDEDAVVDPHELIFNEDAIANPGGVILVEGALDAIKATTYAPLPAVALSTNHVSAAQLRLLKRAHRIIQMVDNDEMHHDSANAMTAQALVLYYTLIKAGIRVIAQPIPRGYKDLAAIPWNAYPKLLDTSRLVTAQR